MPALSPRAPLACLLAFTLLCSTAAASEQTPARNGASALERIERSRVVHVGYIPTPGTFAFRDAAGETVGYSIDVCQRVVQNLRKVLAQPAVREQMQRMGLAPGYMSAQVLGERERAYTATWARIIKEKGFAPQ